jgi:uncharacterized membrane protein (DUF485 family)
MRSVNASNFTELKHQRRAFAHCIVQGLYFKFLFALLRTYTSTRMSVL